MTILEQYRQFRQSGSPDLLYQLADRLDLLCPLEKNAGKILLDRQWSVVRRIEDLLDSPEETLGKAIYRQFHQVGIQMECYRLGVSDESLAAYCQCRSRLYWQRKLSPEEWELINRVESSGIDSSPEFERSISDALDQCLAQFGTWEAA